jgi:hypothetical protein
MTYFLLNLNKDSKDSKAMSTWYLMQGGTELFLDKADLKSSSIPGTTTSYTMQLPRRWFAPDQFRPGTILIKLQDSKNYKSFREYVDGPFAIFKVPFSKDDYDEFLKPENQKLSKLFNKIYELAGDFPSTFPANSISYIFVPPEYENKPLKFPYITFITEDITKDPFTDGFNEPSTGEILMWVTWSMGLTPRPRLIRPIQDNLKDQRYSLAFIPRPQPELSTQPTSIATLAKAVTIFDLEDDVFKKPKNFGDILTNLYEKAKIQVIAPSSLTNQSVKWNLQTDPKDPEDSPKMTFVEIMDTIATLLEATWDWQYDDSVVFLPIKSRNTVREEL